MSTDSLASLRKRIRKAKVARVAEAAEIKPTTLYSFVDGSTQTMRSDTHDKVVAALKVIETKDLSAPPSPSAAELLVDDEAYLPVPIYDIRASAGPGSIAEDGSPIAHQVFRQQWLSNLSRAPLPSLAVIEVSGDSMEPTLTNRDTILVDRSVEKVREDGIYVIFFDDALLVKRCARDLSDGSVIVTSDNPRYREQRLNETDVLQVIGRVIWIGRALG